MAFVELTRILPENKKVKWYVNPNNIVYVQEPIQAGVGCTLVDTSGKDSAVVEAYQDVKAKFSGT